MRSNAARERCSLACTEPAGRKTSSPTSPVYATVNGQPIRSWDDAQDYVGYMQHAIDWLKTEARFASGEDRKSSIAAFEQARAVYEQPGARREANSAAVGGFEIVRGGPLGAIR